MSLENELDKVLSEALPPRRDPPAANLAGRFPARKQPAAQPTSPQKQKGDFASVRKAMRKPMVNLDAQVHNIDKMLNVTQKDPSALGSTVQQIEKSFDGIFDPLKQVRSGVQQLKSAADQFGADYVPGTGQDDKKGGLPPMTPDLAQPQKRQNQLAAKPGRIEAPSSQAGKKTVAPVRRAPDQGEDRYINTVVTDVEMVNNEKDKLAAAKQGWEQYQKTGGKMNRGEFYRSLIKRLRLPSEEQPQESSVQIRKIVENWNKHYDLGQLQPNQGAGPDDQLINKVVTAIETVNNLQDKKSAFRNGWVEYQSAGGRLSHGEFVRAVTNKLKMSQAPADPHL